MAGTADTEAPPAAPPSSQAAPAAQPLPVAQIVMAVALALLVPGLGHVYLKRALRGAIFFVLVMVALGIGCGLAGNLYRPTQGQWLSYLATAAEIGTGVSYFLLRYVVHYEGQQEAPGFEYGTAFLLTAGLMNLLLVLDAWDIGSGRKE